MFRLCDPAHEDVAVDGDANSKPNAADHGKEQTRVKDVAVAVAVEWTVLDVRDPRQDGVEKHKKQED